MTDSTLEEAKRCPKCSEPGQAHGQRPVRSRDSQGARIFGVTPGAMLNEFMCMNKRCRWFNTTWQVQINPDGTIPPPDAPTRARRRLQPLDPALAVTMKDRFESLQELTTKNNGEIRGR